MNLNHLWTNESLSSGLRMAWFLESPSCYLSAVFVADLATLSRQASALVQPCQDQVELERRKEKKKLTKAALPASVAEPRLKTLKLGIEPPKRKDGDCGVGGATTIGVIIINVAMLVF